MVMLCVFYHPSVVLGGPSLWKYDVKSLKSNQYLIYKYCFRSVMAEKTVLLARMRIRICVQNGPVHME